MLSNSVKNYSDRYIDYNLNSAGYRTCEFDRVCWPASIAILGCSQVFGVAIPESDTIAVQLQSRLTVPVINLGVPGASNGSISRVSSELLAAGVRPRAVIIAWTEHTRYYHDLGDTWRDCNAHSDYADLYPDTYNLWRTWIMDEDRIHVDNLRWRRLAVYPWQAVGVPVIEYGVMSDFMSRVIGQTWQLPFDYRCTAALDHAHYDGAYNAQLAETLIQQNRILNRLAT